MTALWLLHHWRLILSAIGFAVLGIMLASAKGESLHWQKQSAQYEGLYRSEVLALAATKANYAAATAQAQAEDAAHVIQVERAQAAITTERVSSYESRLDDLRRRLAAERVRDTKAGSDSSGGGVAGVPEVSEPAAGADDAAAFAAQADAIQLDELQRWVREQVEADPPG